LPGKTEALVLRLPKVALPDKTNYIAVMRWIVLWNSSDATTSIWQSACYEYSLIGHHRRCQSSQPSSGLWQRGRDQLCESPRCQRCWLRTTGIFWTRIMIRRELLKERQTTNTAFQSDNICSHSKIFGCTDGEDVSWSWSGCHNVPANLP
jgi:hypothetical protein